jgi:Rps23 Pro-64 3,4-dihydroxylase Tpa1-like proline 4-hydroxylase
MNNSPLNLENITRAFIFFKNAQPFDHCIIDNFLKDETADKIVSEFLDYGSDRWLVYSNKLENKKALNDWNAFPKYTYSLFSYLNSSDFIKFLSNVSGESLIADPGLHGGGWHCHGVGGNLNPHHDYSIHPKLGLQRVINIIIYISKELQPHHGGFLGLWSHNPEKNIPATLIKEIEPKFNRAVIFNTTQNSWHGMSRNLEVPPDIFRKSLAVYYLREPSLNADPRNKALYAARDNEANDIEIQELIKMRANIFTAQSVYKVKDSK